MILLESEGAFMRRSTHRFFAVLVTISMILSLVPMRSGISAETEKAYVYYTDGENMSLDRSEVGTVTGIIVHAGTWTMTEDLDDDITVLINNASVIAGQYSVSDYYLLGNSEIDYGALKISTNNDYAYPGDFHDHDLEDIYQHVQGLPELLADSYIYTIQNDMTITENTLIDNLVVRDNLEIASGAKLTVGMDLLVAEGGSITGDGVLEFFGNVPVRGLTLYYPNGDPITGTLDMQESFEYVDGKWTMIGHDPEPQGKSIDLRYHGDFDYIRYKIDDGNLNDVAEGQHDISGDILDGDKITFYVQPADESLELTVSYATDLSSQDQGEWNWTGVDAGQDGGYVIPIAEGRFVVEISAGGGEQPADDGLDLRYPSGDFSTFRYKIDNGELIDVADNQHEIARSDLEGHTSVTFYAESNDPERTVKVQYATDLSGEPQDWSWTPVDAGEDGGFTVPVSENKFSVDVYTEGGEPGPGPGPQPMEGTFTLSTVIKENSTGSIGMGMVIVQPNPVVDPLEGGGRWDYTFNTEDYDQIRVTITPDEYIGIDSVTVNGEPIENVTSGGYVYTLSEKPEEGETILIEVVFEPIETQIPVNIAEHGYAYTGTDTAAIKGYLVQEIWNTYFAEGRMYYNKIASIDDLNSSITASAQIVTDDPDEVGLPYVDCTFHYNAGYTPIRVYVLEHKCDFILKYLGAQDNEYHYMTVTGHGREAGNDITVLLDFKDNVEVIGNATGIVGSLISDSKQDVFSGHVTQENAGFVGEEYKDILDAIGEITCRLVIVKPNAGTSAIRIMEYNDCVAWQFEKLSTYAANEDRSQATEANVYIANYYVDITNVDFADGSSSVAVTSVAVDSESGLNSTIIDVYEMYSTPGVFRVSFMSNYDLIPLKIGFADGTFKYITLHRVALRINFNNVEFDESGDPSVNCIHGTWMDDWKTWKIEGEFNRDTANSAVFGTYYFPTGTRTPDVGDMVTLFVTVTIDGRRESKLVTTPISDADAHTEQGMADNIYYADFLLWAGTKADLDRISDVDVIVYKAGDDISFGGVMAGSATSVHWAPGQ